MEETLERERKWFGKYLAKLTKASGERKKAIPFAGTFVLYQKLLQLN